MLTFGVMLCCLLTATAFASDYTVVPGDCLWRIARRELGEGVRWPEIYELNRQQIKDPHWIYPGQVFAIPADGSEAAEAVAAAPAEEARIAQAAQAPAETPTDYADESSWIARPTAEKETDTLYFVGDCYYMTSVDGPVVCGIDNRGMRVGARADFAENKAAYANTNVFAPYFRQVGVYNEKLVDKDALLGDPRADVYAALDYYFTHLNNGRAFQLAGRGQGAELVYAVMEDYLAQHPQLQARLATAQTK